MMSMRSRCRTTMLKEMRLRCSDATDMSIEFTGDASIEPLVLSDLEADITGETFICSIGRVKRELKVVLRMRLVDDRERLVSAKCVDVEVATRALVAKTSADDATTVAVEVSTVVDRSHEKAKRMSRVRGMCNYLLHLAARLVEREVAWPARVNPAVASGEFAGGAWW